MQWKYFKVVLASAVMLPTALVAREVTTRKNLVPANHAEVEQFPIEDSLKVENALVFHNGIVKMRGYAKRAGASKETFMLTNCSNMHLSSIEIVFRYVDMEGTLIHERRENVVCDLPPYTSRQASVKTFDEGKNFYYYKSKSRKGAIAYDVSIRVQSYNIKVERKD